MYSSWYKWLKALYKLQLTKVVNCVAKNSWNSKTINKYKEILAMATYAYKLQCPEHVTPATTAVLMMWEATKQKKQISHYKDS